MNFAIAAPLALGLATTAAKAVQETASGMFSLMAESNTQAEDTQSASGSVMDLFAQMGQLGLEDVEGSLKQSLEGLEDLIRTHFFKADTPLPDQFQLRMDASGQVRATGAGELDAQIERLLQEDPEANGLVRKLATDFSQLSASQRQREYASRYNADPESADEWMQSAQKEKSPFDVVDLHFAAGDAPIYRSAAS